MNGQFSQIKWVRVILAALVVYVLSYLLVFLIVTGYATLLAFQARGAPDQTMIESFANQFAPWIGPVSLLIFTYLGARHGARRVESAHELHGILLGALAGLISLFSEGFGLVTLVTVVLTIAAGWLGGKQSIKG